MKIRNINGRTLSACGAAFILATWACSKSAEAIDPPRLPEPTLPQPLARQDAAQSAAEVGLDDAAPALVQKSAPLADPPAGMLLVPGGSFKMGPPEEYTGGVAPLAATVAPFFIDRLEVSAEAYLACVKAGRCELLEHEPGCNATDKKPRPTHPMNCVTQAQALRFCSEQGKRLPTEAEWEFAARGSDGRFYPWGNEAPREQLCWQKGKKSAKRRTCPVGSYPQAASPFGALDMAGNVAEWTGTADKETAGRGVGAFVIRGGGYEVDSLSSPEYPDVRADKSDSRSALRTGPELGFRCAKSP